MTHPKGIVLDLCGGSGAWSKPWAAAGYDVRVITLPHHDVYDYTPPRTGVVGVLAAPPCTQFSFVLNEKIKRDIPAALGVVHSCQRIIAECQTQESFRWWALENPIGHLNKYLGQPSFTFQPWEFGDPWTKRTGIWGEFALPTKTHECWELVEQIPDLYIRPGRKKPNMVWLHKSAKESIASLHEFDAPTDAAFRAITPQGFARAFFEANQ